MSPTPAATPGPVVTVTPNPALDVTYRVARFEAGTSHRVEQVLERAGGKGVNVASVLHAMGVPVVATGLLAGPGGQRLRADLDGRGIRHRFVEVGRDDPSHETRRTLTVVEDAGGSGDATAFSEPGPVLSRPESERAVDELAVLLHELRPAVVVVTGSWPPGIDEGSVARLLAVAAGLGARTVLDTGGSALLRTLRRSRDDGTPAPDVVKPNRPELRELLTGAAPRGGDDAADVEAGVGLLRDHGARTVVVSSGGAGLSLHPTDGPALAARLPRPLTGHPTGAGDAAVAALAAGLRTGAAWPQVVTDAAAWSAAAVLHPVAGQVDPRDVARLRTQVAVTPLTG